MLKQLYGGMWNQRYETYVGASRAEWGMGVSFLDEAGITDYVGIFVAEEKDYSDFIIGICFKKCHWMNNTNIYKSILYKIMCKISEWFYKISRSKYGLNLPPEDARWILPLDVMSKVAYTYTVKDWERIINMRLYDWTGKAHPDAKIVAKEIKTILEDLGYNIINYKEEHGYKSSLV